MPRAATDNSHPRYHREVSYKSSNSIDTILNKQSGYNKLPTFKSGGLVRKRSQEIKLGRNRDQKSFGHTGFYRSFELPLDISKQPSLDNRSSNSQINPVVKPKTTTMLSSTGPSSGPKVPLATPNKKGLLFFKNIEEGYQANISSAKRSIVVEPYSAI